MSKTTTQTATTTPTVEDLDRELQAKRSAHSVAVQSVADAEAAFDRAGDEKTARALADARAAAGIAEDFVRRAERLLQAGKDAAAVRRRAEIEEEIADLESKTSRAAILERATPLAEEEAEALARVAEIRQRRRALAVEIDAFVRRTSTLQFELDPTHRFHDRTGFVSDLVVNADAVSKLLAARAGATDAVPGTIDDFAALLWRLRPTHDDYSVGSRRWDYTRL